MKKIFTILKILMGFTQSIISMNNQLNQEQLSFISPQNQSFCNNNIDSFILQDMKDLKKNLNIKNLEDDISFSSSDENDESTMQNKSEMGLINFFLKKNPKCEQLLTNYMNTNGDNINGDNIKEELLENIIEEIKNRSKMDFLSEDQHSFHSILRHTSNLIAHSQAAKLILEINNFQSLIQKYLDNSLNNNNFNMYEYCLKDNDIDEIYQQYTNGINTNAMKLLKHHLKKDLLNLKQQQLSKKQQQQIINEQQSTKTFKTKIINFIKKVVRPISMTFIVGCVVLLFVL
jgi:hypothetical protein